MSTDSISVNPADYAVKSYVQEGAMGKVFAAVRKTDGKKVAMKFFGYTTRAPHEADMEKEIQLLLSLRGIEGIVQLEGVFLDTVDGMLPGKKFKGEFPVIVMEMIEGGELFDRINNRSSVSESDLAEVFTHTIVALQSLHERKFIHRDLKLENLMLVNMAEDSKIKLIDFGMMVRIPPPQVSYRTGQLQGTAGYYAPESITEHEYSYKTDIWQAGCILYCMLSGLPPYNPRYPKQITHHSYFPMTGDGWDSISDLAKDLIKQVLNKDRNERLSCEEILKHPWLRGKAPSTSLGPDYFTRIKHLVLRGKFKTFFLENDITEDNKSRRSKLELMLPFLSQADEVCEADDAEVVETKRARAASNSEELQKFREKLVVLRAFMIQALVSQKKDESSDWTPAATEAEAASSDMGSSTLGLPAPPAAPVEGEVDYHVFVDMLKRADLMELASPAVFNIFDIGKTRTIDLKEFLTTMLAFRPEDTDTDAARLYFNIFDIQDTGFIDKDELRICLELLLMDDSSRGEGGAGSLPKVDEVFDTMDFTNTGSIDFNEFKTFYEAVLTATTMTSSVEKKDNHSSAAPALAALAEAEETEPLVKASAPDGPVPAAVAPAEVARDKKAGGAPANRTANCCTVQ
jgi:serine/threonine protein kinase/Ca2+-binding EF-hand superfamily protein